MKHKNLKISIYKNMKCTDEELVLFATSIAMELAKGLSQEEIEELRNLVNQISCSLSTLLMCGHHRFKK